MPEQSTPDFPLPFAPEQQPPKRERRRYKLFVWLFAAVGLALIAAVSFYLIRNKPQASNAPTIRSVTYYYRDGKTVLWQGTRLAEADSPAFVHAVADSLIDRYGESFMEQNSKWDIVTTLDKSLQEVGQQQVAAMREQLSKQHADDAALIAQDVATGQIVTWVGGLNGKVFYNGKDRLTTATQPGSLVLPLVYAVYMDNTGANADTLTTDTRGPLPGYACTNPALPQQGGDCLYNYDHKYVGQVTLRQALAGLRLVPAVQAMTSAIAGDTSAGRIDSITKTVTSITAMMGSSHGYTCYLSRADGAPIDAPEETPCYGAAAIGEGAYAKPSDLLNAFGTLANNGERLPQAYYLRLEQDGKVLDAWKAPAAKRVVKASTASTITDILSDASSSYMTRKDYFSLEGKTKVSTISGFVHDNKTASALQYTPQYAVGFWAFSDQGQITGFGQQLALPPAHGWLGAAVSR